jgi:hypothetical protein
MSDLEDRAQRRAFAADTVYLGVRQADALQAVARPYEQDALDVVRGFGFDDYALRAVRRPGIGVDEDRP